MLYPKFLIFNSYGLLQRRLCSKSTRKSTKWKSVVGLEVHAQIQSESKLFSGAATKFSNPVNTNVAPFDIATPGTLPVLNKRCVEAGILTALALNCKVNPVSYFDRKHYFYADMPSGYQITQQRAPLASSGRLEFHVFTPGVQKSPYKTSVQIKQLQLEQDSGKSLHDFDRSLVDLNRAGVPLMELVFEPDLTDGEEAAAVIKELSIILQRIQTCTCKMEEGALRVDANVSIHKEGEPMGTRAEVKNIGSVRGVAAAVKYEIERQIKIREANGTIMNETRAWDAENKITVPMRDKEVQQDYRFMPEPNLPPLLIAMGPIDNGWVNADKIRETIPELPEQSRVRLQEDFGLSSEQSIILVNDYYLFDMFEGVLKNRASVNPKMLANFLTNELNNALNKLNLDVHDLKFSPHHLGEIVELLQGAVISRKTGKLVLQEMLNGNPNSPLKIVEDNTWKQITDETELTEICESVLKQNERAVNDYLSGKPQVLKALLGALANATQNRADMAKCNVILKKLLLKRLK